MRLLRQQVFVFLFCVGVCVKVFWVWFAARDGVHHRRRHLQVLTSAGSATTAESLLLILVLDGWLDGFKEIALRLQDLLDRLDPLVGGFGAGRVTDEGAMSTTGRSVRPTGTRMSRIRRLDDELERLAGLSDFEFLVQRHFVHLWGKKKEIVNEPTQRKTRNEITWIWAL